MPVRASGPVGLNADPVSAAWAGSRELRLDPLAFKLVARVLMELSQEPERFATEFMARLPSAAALDLPTPEVSDEVATRMVAAHLLELTGSRFFPSDVAEGLRLPLDQVERALERLSDQGAIRLD